MSDAAQVVKEAVDIVELASRYTDLTPSGQDYRGRCPIHGGDSTSAFIVSPERGSYKCFRCGAYGDAISLVRELEGLSFPEALRHLAEVGGVELPRDTPAPRPKSPVEAVLDDAVKFWRAQLETPEASHARAYLESRGISSNVWHPAGIGYCPEPTFRTFAHLLESGHSEAVIELSKIYNSHRSTDLAGKIVVPIRTHGKVTNLYGRAVGLVAKDQRHRYTDAHSGLYGLDTVRRGSPAVLVEGIFDALALVAAGGKGIVATYGTGGVSNSAVEQLLEAGPNRVVVFFDGDEAGRSSARRAVKLLAEANLPSRVVLTPPGEDPASLVASEVNVAGLVRAAADPRLLDVLTAVESVERESLAGKLTLAAVAERCAQIPMGPLVAEVVAGHLADALGADRQTMAYHLQNLSGINTPQ